MYFVDDEDLNMGMIQKVRCQGRSTEMNTDTKEVSMGPT